MGHFQFCRRYKLEQASKTMVQLHSHFLSPLRHSSWLFCRWSGIEIEPAVPPDREINGEKATDNAQNRYRNAP